MSHRLLYVPLSYNDTATCTSFKLLELLFELLYTHKPKDNHADMTVYSVKIFRVNMFNAKEQCIYARGNVAFG